MSPEQRRLARHALGLPNERNLSFRNRFVAPAGTADHQHWVAMVTRGWARDVFPPFSSGDRFCLTLEGAGQAVDPGERLDPEDFVMREGR